jgi:hypothetical protein
LDKAFTAEQSWLDRQNANLAKSSTAVDKAQALIDQMSAKGIDVSGLQALLDTLNTQIGTVKSVHTTAADILTSHAGFDAQGHATAIDQARQTIQSARQALQSAATGLTQAFKDLSQGIKTWRGQHKTSGGAKPGVTPTPTVQPGM